MIQNFTDLLVWQHAHMLVLATYQSTRSFPRTELFGLTNQMQRSAVSITSNIAEGFGRKTLKDKIHFYYISRGSLTELQNQFITSKDLNYLEEKHYQKIIEQISNVHKLLNGIIGALSKKLPSPNS